MRACARKWHSPRTRMIEEMGAIVQFLPPYSPDFNPIEVKSYVCCKGDGGFNHQWHRPRNTIIINFLCFYLNENVCQKNLGL